MLKLGPLIVIEKSASIMADQKAHELAMKKQKSIPVQNKQLSKDIVEFFNVVQQSTKDEGISKKDSSKSVKSSVNKTRVGNRRQDQYFEKSAYFNAPKAQKIPMGLFMN